MSADDDVTAPAPAPGDEPSAGEPQGEQPANAPGLDRPESAPGLAPVAGPGTAGGASQPPRRRGLHLLVLTAGLALAFAFIPPRHPLVLESSPGAARLARGGGGGDRVEVARPRRGPIVARVEASGTIRCGREVGLGAPFEGRVLELVRDEGDRIEEGGVAFQLDPTEHRDRVAEAEIDLARKRSALAEAEQERDKAQRELEDAALESSEVTEARLRVRQSELEAQRARAQLDAAESKLTRTRTLRQQGIGTDLDVETAQGEQRVSAIGVRIAEEQLALARETLGFRERALRLARAAAAEGLAVSRARLLRARADLDAAEVALARARRDLERCAIRSPIAGVVTGRSINQGDLVGRAAAGEAHVIVSDLTRLYVEVDVDETDVVRVQPGQPAVARVGALVRAGGPERLDGAVLDVGMRAATRQGQEVPSFRVRVLLRPDQPGHDKLRPGMTATVTLEVAREDEALKVPLQAVVQRELRDLPEAVRAAAPPGVLAGLGPYDLLDVVFTVQGDRAMARIIRRGVEDTDEVALPPDALAEDAEVVVGPFRRLEELTHEGAVTPEPAELALPDEAPAAPGAGR